MPIDRSLYPIDWDDISAAIRAAAGDRCEQCGVPNRVWIVRSSSDPSRYVTITDDYEVMAMDGSYHRLSEIPDEFMDNPEVHIVLTVAHLDQNPANNDLDNLKALCQRCHLNHDRPHNIVKRNRTRLDNKQRAILDSGQLPLID